MLDAEHPGKNTFIIFFKTSAECLVLNGTFKILNNSLIETMHF